jgi:hypothetical protein
VTAPADTMRPTVSLTRPASGAVVTGSVILAAEASDDRGMVGIQFKVDWKDFGAEDTEALYQRNIEASETIAVTVSNAGS